MAKVDREFAEKFLTSVDDFDAYGVHLLFNEWWERAPDAVIAKYVAAIEQHPEQGPLAREGWYAEPPDLERLRGCAPGTLGEAYYRFVVDNNLEARLAVGYRALHEEYSSDGKLKRMPGILQYKVLRGYQTHDLHHVLTGYAATPKGEFALQVFGLAQMPYPYAAMWVAVVTSHMALLDPELIELAMDAISDGWAYGKQARNIQLVAFENQLDRPLSEIRQEYGLVRQATAKRETRSPTMLQFA